MADENGCQRVLHVVLPPERGSIRIFHLDRPLYHVHVLRSGPHPDVSSHRSMGKRPQGVFGHEADPDAHGWIGPASYRYPRHLLRLWSNDHEHSGNSTDAQYTDESPAHLVPDNLHRIRSARSPVPVPYMEPGRTCFSPYRSINAACRGTDEARRLRMLPGSDVPPAGSGTGAQLDFHNTHYDICGLRSVLRLRADACRPTSNISTHILPCRTADWCFSPS